jgi:phosphoglycolate phosphatase
MMDRRATIVFDLDGTLVDTAPDLIGALNHVLTIHGRPVLAPEMVRKVVGFGAAVTIERGTALTGGIPAADIRAKMLEQFLAYYTDHIADYSRPFDGAEDCLKRLANAGFILGLCTNKPESLSRKLLAQLKLDHYFASLLGGDTLAVRKPDPTHVIETIRRAGGQIPFAVMIGDSSADIDAAKSANIPSIAVSFGYSDRPVADLGPDRIIKHFDELDRVAQELLTP